MSNDKNVFNLSTLNFSTYFFYVSISLAEVVTITDPSTASFSPFFNFSTFQLFNFSTFFKISLQRYKILCQSMHFPTFFYGKHAKNVYFCSLKEL